MIDSKIHQLNIMCAKAWLILLFLLPFWCMGQTVLYEQGWEEVPNNPRGSNGLFGFEQYNNQTWSHQNVWGRRGVNGANAGGSRAFRTLNPLINRCIDSEFDSCIVAESANKSGKNGLHIMTGSNRPTDDNIPPFQFNASHTGYHAGPVRGGGFNGNGQTASTRVGLYSPKIQNNSGFTKLELEFWLKVNGELNRDYGLIRYSTRPDAPAQPIADGVVGNAPDDYWKTIEFDQMLTGELADTLLWMCHDTMTTIRLTPPGSTVPGQLQGYVAPNGYTSKGIAVPAGTPLWVKARLPLPEDALNSPNLRFGFWWVNDNNDVAGFPSFIVDDVKLVGYQFSIDKLNNGNLCVDQELNLPFTIDAAFFDQSIRNRDMAFYAVMSDHHGNFRQADTIGLLTFDKLKREGKNIRGVIRVKVGRNTVDRVSGGYRVKIVAPVSGHSSAPSQSLTVYPQPKYTITPADTAVCAGQPVILRLDGPPSNQVRWTLDGKTLAHGSTFTYTATDSGKYVAVVQTNGCTTPSDTATISYLPTPVVQLVLPQNEICWGANIDTLKGGSPAGGTYFWYYEGVTERQTGTRFLSVRAGEGPHKIGYEIEDTVSKCKGVAYDSVTVLPAPVAQLANTDTVLLCEGKPLRLTPSKSAASYRWNTGDTTKSITTPTGGRFWVLLTSANGCTYQTDTVTVIVVPSLPERPAINTPLNVGDSRVTGTATRGPVGNTIVFLFINERPITQTNVRRDGTWSIDLPRPLQQNDRVYVRAQYDTNCDGVIGTGDVASAISDIITVGGRLVIPNGFSPNGDGVNDTWEVFVPGTQDSYRNSNLSIYTRWGTEVLSVDGYRNDWNGKFNDVDLPAGTYYYVLDLKDGTELYKGYVTLMR
jgi:gliding motility-associated-like protein